MGLAVGLMAAGMGVQALSNYRQAQYAETQAKAQAKISDYNAQAEEANAEAIKQKSVFDQIRALKRGEKIMGKLRAGLGASGAVMTEGAPADVVAEQGFENALDVALIGYEGMTEAARRKSRAGAYRYEAANYLQRAKYAKKMAPWAAAAPLLSGFGGMYSMGMFSKGGSSSGGMTWNQTKAAMNNPYYYG